MSWIFKSKLGLIPCRLALSTRGRGSSGVGFHISISLVYCSSLPLGGGSRDPPGLLFQDRGSGPREGGVGRDEWAPQALISAKLDFAVGPGSMHCRVMIGAAGEG